ncbi:MAG: hypothetical protein JWM43_3630 [Acidobacteriaceae bacterium]|nr:hypothetical protein [Acidobacteriaceae bacterium]
MSSEKTYILAGELLLGMVIGIIALIRRYRENLRQKNR